ncbi:MAG: CdaR family protein [Oscillospiraceae bacterium]
MNNNKLSKLLDNSRFLLLLSFIVSLTMWAYVVVYINNEHTTIIRNVPINMQYRQSATYQSLGLDVIEMDIKSVSVSITGPRSVTGDLTAEDIIVYPTIVGIDGAGKYTLKLTAEKTSSVKDFSIGSMSHDTITVRFDRLITKEVPVEMDISSVSVSSEYIADKPSASPAKVTITGPEYKVSGISKAVAKTMTQETLTQSAVLPTELILYDANGALIESDLLTFDNEHIEITIPVLKEVILPVRVEYVNVPQGFDVSTLHQSVSQTVLRLAVPSQIADNITDFVVGYMDLATLELDKKYAFDVKLPAGYRSMDEVNQVFATVSSENLMEKKVAVTEIKVINGDKDGIKVLTQIISNVVVVGTKEAVESLSSGSVIAQVDATRLTGAVGQQSVEVSFIIPPTDKAYVKGVYTVTIKN